MIGMLAGVAGAPHLPAPMASPKRRPAGSRRTRSQPVAPPTAPPTDAAAAVDACIAEFSPAHQRLIADVRAAMRRRFPAAHELVYDNYNFFVIGYSATLRPSDAALSIAASAKGVSLCFLHGARLADPAGLLEGEGKQTRFLRVEAARDLDRPAVAALLATAAATAPVPLGDGPPGTLVMRSVSAKRRPRRASS